MDRTNQFGRRHAGAFAAGSRGAKAFAELAAVVEEMRQAGADRLSGEGAYHAGTSEKQFRAGELREDLEAIRDTAVAIAAAEGTPDFDEQFRVPRSKSYDVLAASARAFLRDAAPHKALFVEFELPADFLEDLAADLEKFEKAADAQDDGLGQKVGGGANLAALAAKGMNLRKQLLALVANKFRGNAEILAEWRTATDIAWPERKAREPATPA